MFKRAGNFRGEWTQAPPHPHGAAVEGARLSLSRGAGCRPRGASGDCAFLYPAFHAALAAANLLEFAQQLQQLPVLQLQTRLGGRPGFVIGDGQPQGDAAQRDLGVVRTGALVARPGTLTPGQVARFRGGAVQVREIAARGLADFAQGEHAQPVAIALGQRPDTALDIAELTAKLTRTQHDEEWSEYLHEFLDPGLGRHRKPRAVHPRLAAHRRKLRAKRHKMTPDLSIRGLYPIPGRFFAPPAPPAATAGHPGSHRPRAAARSR